MNMGPSLVVRLAQEMLLVMEPAERCAQVHCEVSRLDREVRRVRVSARERCEARP